MEQLKLGFSLGNSLLAENYSLILFNCSLTLLNNVFMLLCLKSKLVTSVNITGTKYV